MPAAPAQTTDRDPARAVRAHRSAGALLPNAAWCRTGIRGAAASGRNHAGTAPRPGPQRTLERRSRAPLLPPSIDVAALGPHHGFGKRIDRHVPREVAIQHGPEHERAGAFECQLVDLHGNFQPAAERQRTGPLQPPDDAVDANRTYALDLAAGAVIRAGRVQLQ